MAGDQITTVRLDGPAREDMERLITALRRDIGVKTVRDEIVRALIWGVSPPQAAGMLAAYIKHAEKRRTGNEP
jgi:hypothetical protein